MAMRKTAAANRAALARRRLRLVSELSSSDQEGSSVADSDRPSEEDEPTPKVKHTASVATATATAAAHPVAIIVNPSTTHSNTREQESVASRSSAGDITPTKSNTFSSSSLGRPGSKKDEKAPPLPYLEQEKQQQQQQQQHLERLSLIENQQVQTSQSQPKKKSTRIAVPLQPQSEVVLEKENMQEEFFVEDPEPVVQGKEIVDATVLHHKSMVLLKTFVGCQTLRMEEQDSKYMAQLSGLGLAAPEEVVEIHQRTLSSTDTCIRYGQPIVFYSRTAKAYLGVRNNNANNKSGLDGIQLELGFFRSTISQVEIWTILHPNRKLLVGSTARTVKQQHSHTMSVRVGDTLVLRNNWIGGLLSAKEGLSLVTQSYNSDEQDARTSLVDRALLHYEIFPSDTELFQLWRSHTPPCPNWAYRPKKQMQEYSHPPSNLQYLTPMNQEQLCLDEVIGSLIGLEGNLVRKEQNDEFHVAKGAVIDKSLATLMERILPISTGFARVKVFLRQHQPGYDYGLVLQAMCEEMNIIVGEYLDAVGALDKRFRHAGYGDKVTMNHTFIEIQQLGSIMTLLQHVILCAQDNIGGALLNALRDLHMSVLAGDLHKQKLLQRLLNKASVPWMNMLNRWLKSGELEDPCGEFMVMKNRSKKFNGDHWNEIFCSRSEQVFKGAIASRQLEETVLSTGRYWNAIRRCENAVHFDTVVELDNEGLRYNGDPSTLATFIEQTHKRASADLLDLMFGKFKIETTLLTLKRYFLLDQGDFLVHFMDTAVGELTKPVDDVSMGRTQHYLNMALQLTDSADVDVASTVGPQPLLPHCIRCFFAEESLDVMLGVRDGEQKTPSRHPYGQVVGLTGMLAFTLDFPQIPFPTSLLLSRQNINCYQMLFRHIFYAKHIEQRLVDVWLDNQMMKEFHSLRGLLGPTFCLRQRMLHFIQNFIYFMMLEVIEPNWLKLMDDISKPKSMDHLLALHNDFLYRVMEACLLSNPALFKALAKIMSTCLTFSEQMKRFVQTIGIDDDTKVTTKRNRRRDSMTRERDKGTTKVRRDDRTKTMHAERKERQARLEKQKILIQRELENETFQRMIKRHEEVFDNNLDDFMGKLKFVGHHESKIANLCIRLDYNGFLSRRSKGL